MNAQAQLAAVWVDFEQRLSAVPIVQRIEGGSATLEDYRALLRDMRQQVVEGSRWIALTAANIGPDLFPIRSMLLQHAAEEHRDFQMLERDYCAVGGSLDEIQHHRKNLGSEALSSYIFHQASLPDPVHLFGAMFIIEGLGRRKGSAWAEKLRESLGLDRHQLSFLLHHGQADGGHVEKMQRILTLPVFQGVCAERLVTCARVVARLYVMQLEEVGNA